MTLFVYNGTKYSIIMDFCHFNSLRRNTRILDHLRPLCRFGLDQRRKLLGCLWLNVEADIRKALPHIRRSKCFDHVGIQSGQDRFRYARRCAKPVPRKVTGVASCLLPVNRQ